MSAIFRVAVYQSLWLVGALAFAAPRLLAPLFILSAYLALLTEMVVTGYRSREWVHPLAIVLLGGAVRYGIPGVLMLLGGEPDFESLQRMRLETLDWTRGHVLALLGLLGVVIGWHLSGRRWAAALSRATAVRPQGERGVRLAASLALLLGVGALSVFVSRNASPWEVIRTGGFRGTEIQVGTGLYFFLGMLTIAGSVVLSASLLERSRRAGWLPLLPILLAAAAYWPLGGRARALTPVAAGLLLLWGRRRDLRPSVKWGVVLASLLLPFVLYTGKAYRSGGGIEGMVRAFSWPALNHYVAGAIWNDWGQLHALAGAAVIGPAALDGRAFLTLTFPFSKVFDLGGRSAGVLIAERLHGFTGGRRWGFHASLIGDAFLHFGLTACLIASAALGAGLRALYAAGRRGMPAALYALGVVYGFRVFFESVERYPEAFTVFVSAAIVLRLGKALHSRRVPALVAPGAWSPKLWASGLREGP